MGPKAKGQGCPSSQPPSPTPCMHMHGMGRLGPSTWVGRLLPEAGRSCLNVGRHPLGKCLV